MYMKLARMVGYVRSHMGVHVCIELNVVQVQVPAQVLVLKVHELTDNTSLSDDHGLEGELTAHSRRALEHYM